jgi:hypothetical protein
MRCFGEASRLWCGCSPLWLRLPRAFGANSSRSFQKMWTIASDPRAHLTLEVGMADATTNE